jgi:hypothetical protein
VKVAAVLIVLLVVAGIATQRALGPDVDPDVPVMVRTADPVRVLLPSTPKAADIEARSRIALTTAAGDLTGPIADEIRAIATDDEYMEWVAESGAEAFAAERAAALAYPLYSVIVTDSLVTITAVTLELLPQHFALGASIGHENGHALINETIARECGPAVVAELAAGRRRGAGLENAVENLLFDIGSDAHARYHEVVNNGVYPRYVEAAREAAAVTVAERCQGP